MFKPGFAVYLGEEREEGFTGFVAEGNLFCILEIEEGITKEKGRKLLNVFVNRLQTKGIDRLSSFESMISSEVKQLNIPARFSLAAVYLKEKVVYLKTIGEGEIYLRRKKELAKIIGGDNSASGYPQAKDLFLLTTKNFVSLFKDRDELEKIFDHNEPFRIVDRLTPELKGKKEQGTIALFVSFEEKGVIEEEEATRSYQGRDLLSFKNIIRGWLTRIRLVLYGLEGKKTKKKKALTLAIVILILFIFIWSVGLGYKRRQEAKIVKKISLARQEIEKKLNKADEEAFFNLDKSLKLISQAKEDFSKLKQDIGPKPRKEIREIKELIAKKEAKILKKEKGNFKEFFDLKIVSKKAKGIKMFLLEKKLAILDPSGRAYILSLPEKSIEKKGFPKLGPVDLIAYSLRGDLFLLVSNEAVYRIDSNDKIKKVIELKDEGEVVDIGVYNRNLYLLDTANDEIYKYIPAGDIYSAKKSYFKPGQAVDLSQANSIAIDSSIYIGFPNKIIKYTSGIREKFKTDFPEKDLSLTKIYTDKNTEKIFAWDKVKGAVYILAKNGSYEREISSPIFKKGDDFTFYQGKIYVLAGSKLYTIAID